MFSIPKNFESIKPDSLRILKQGSCLTVKGCLVFLPKNILFHLIFPQRGNFSFTLFQKKILIFQKRKAVFLKEAQLVIMNSFVLVNCKSKNSSHAQQDRQRLHENCK